MKFEFKDQFRALIKVGGKFSTFPKSTDTLDELSVFLEKAGLSVSNVITIETFKVLEEKQRGRTKSRY